ncbi:MAG TPA: beta-galactosidase, partial [Microbacteriaceae bacterium]
LNEAWYTRFWSQSYGTFDEIPLPGFTSYGTSPNPGMELDFKRFSSDALLGIYLRERDLIREFDKETPITTNFMSMRHITAMNYWEWAKEVDLVSTDHYLDFASSDRNTDLAFQADLTRAFAGGKQWLLMEHSTSAVNWQPVNPIKSTKQIVSDSLEHIFRGSQGAMFFQFRQSRGGSERFHSALVPAAGIDTRVGRALKELSSKIQDIGQLAANVTERAKVAIVFDFEDQWVTQQANLPSSKLDYFQEVFKWYKALSQLSVRVDFIDKGESFLEFSEYDYVFAPMMHIVDQDLAERLLKFVEGGGYFYSTYFSGISDKNLQFSVNGMGAEFLGPVFGVKLEEFAPMLAQEGKLSNGLRHSLWRELINVEDQQTIIASFEDAEELTGWPAIVSKTVGSGRSVYVATSLDDNSLVSFLTNELNISNGHQPVEVTRGKLQFLRDLSGQHKITDVMPSN